MINFVFYPCNSFITEQIFIIILPNPYESVCSLCLMSPQVLNCHNELIYRIESDKKYLIYTEIAVIFPLNIRNSLVYNVLDVYLNISVNILI